MRVDPDLIARLEGLAHLELNEDERALLAARMAGLLEVVAALEPATSQPPDDAPAVAGPIACPRRDDVPAPPATDDPLGAAPRDDRGLVPSPPPTGRSVSGG